MGLRASLKEELDSFEEPPTWEYQTDWEWKPCPQDVAVSIDVVCELGKNDVLWLACWSDPSVV